MHRRADQGSTSGADDNARTLELGDALDRRGVVAEVHPLERRRHQVSEPRSRDRSSGSLTASAPGNTQGLDAHAVRKKT